MGAVEFHMKLAPVAATGGHKRDRSKSTNRARDSPGKDSRGAPKKKARGSMQLALTAGPQSELEALRAENARLRATASRAPPGNFTGASSSGMNSGGGGSRGTRGGRNNRGNRNNPESNQKRADFMPDALRGGVNRLPDGRAICFGFNLGDCTKAAPGGTCNRGVHACCSIGCGGSHPRSQCPRR